MSSAGSGASMYGYTGEQTDATNLIFLRARFYSPAQGRLIQHDAWPGDYNQPQTLNGWAYVEGNPVNRVDPTGKWGCYTDLAWLFNPDCTAWIETGLVELEQSGTVGRKLVEFFYQYDNDLMSGCLGIPPLPSDAFGVKFGFMPALPGNAVAITLVPGAILFNSSLPGYQGATPTNRAVVTLGHEISHLAQGEASVSVQGEVLSTIVAYYLESALGEEHRFDAKFIFENEIDPWSDTDLETYRNYWKQFGVIIPGPLVYPFGDIPKEWLTRFGIYLPYLSSNPRRGR